MALVKCPECGHDVSSFANQCPHCGCPQNMFNRSVATINITPKQVPTSFTCDEFEIEDGVLIKYKGSGTEVVIPEGVIHIGERAFYNCSFIKSITIPKSLKSIGKEAFSGNIENCVEYGHRIYRTNLSRINIADVATWCNIDFGDGSIFRYGRGIKSRELYIYQDNEKITNVVIPNGVTSISDFAFYLYGIKSISLPHTIKKMGHHIVADLDEIDIYITDISAWCEIERDWNWINYIARTKVHLYLNDVLITDLKIPETVTRIRTKTFDRCVDIKTLTLPNSVTSIGTYAFTGSKIDVYITDLEALCNIEYGDGEGPNPFSFENLYLNGESVTDLIIPNGVTSVCGFSFRNIKSVTIPNSVTRIGGYAFYCCTSLATVIIPDSVNSIGYGAFGGCTSLKSITIPDSVNCIGKEAFTDCKSLATIVIGNGVTSINNLFRGCTAIANISIGDGVTSIDDLFKGNTTLTTVSIGDGVTSIVANAFAGCRSLKTIKLGKSITSIGEYAFDGCEKLTDITIPNSVMSIGHDAFYNCYNLKNVFISDIKNWCNISFSNDNANPLCRNCTIFLNGKRVTDLIIPGCVSSVGSRAFVDCETLISVKLEKGITSIEFSAFSGCKSLATITIPESVTYICDYAFLCCDNVTFYVTKGSFAEKYALERGIPFRTL